MHKTISYDSNSMKDLSQKIVSENINDPRFLYNEYFILDGERPDTLSNKFYGVPYYHWVILVTNDLTLKSWPMSDLILSKYLDKKYGSSIDDIKHYVDSNNTILDYSFPSLFATLDSEGDEILNNYHFNGEGLGEVAGEVVYFLGEPVTNRQYEIAKNDEKKKIKILDKAFISDITALAKRLLK